MTRRWWSRLFASGRIPGCCTGEGREIGAPLLEVRNLGVSFRGRAILKDVSFAVPAQRLTAVLGPSGAGKSTLLRALNRLLEETEGFTIEGEALLWGRDTLDPAVDPDYLRRCLGLVSQKPVVFPLSIRDNVLFGVKHLRLAPRARWDAIVEEALQAVGLWDEARDRLHETARSLSVGQQQRLCIARALAVRPEALLLDEPTSALDFRAAERIESLLVSLKRRCTLVLVTHDLGQAARLAEHAVYLQPDAAGARVTYTGAVRQLVSSLVREAEAGGPRVPATPFDRAPEPPA